MQVAAKHLAKHRLSMACACWKAAVHVSKDNHSQAYSMGLLSTQRHVLETWKQHMQNTAKKQKVATTHFQQCSAKWVLLRWRTETVHAAHRKEQNRSAYSLLRRVTLNKVRPAGYLAALMTTACQPCGCRSITLFLLSMQT